MLSDRVEHVLSVLKKESQGFEKPPKLVAVTKFTPAEDMLSLLPLGIRDVGENRVQVLREKLPVISGKFSLHFIGRLQTNKVKYIIKDVSMIHSVDSMELCQEIDRQAQKACTRMDILLQVNIAHEPQKAGVHEDEVLPLLKQASLLPGLRVKGLMTMMPLGADREFIFEKFCAMRRLLDICKEENISHTDMTELSMGMSQDYDLAARAGATMVRVGTALWKE